MKSTQTVPTLAFCSVATGPSRSDFSTVRHGRVSDMRILLLAGVAALFLATGAAHAVENECKAGDTYCQCDNKKTGNGCRYKWPSPNFVIDCRRDRLFVYFDKEDYTDDGVLQGGK